MEPSVDIEELEGRIAANPFDESALLAAISLLASSATSAASNEVEGLRTKATCYRNAYVERFSPSVGFWLEWLNFEKAHLSTSGPEAVKVLFDRALEACPHDVIVMAYVEDMQDKLDAEIIDEDEMREAFERAVSICGVDILSGAKLWQLYCAFELDEHRDVVEVAESESEITASKQRVIRVYHRILSLPMAGSETVLTEFERVLGEICVDSDVKLVDPEGLQKKVAAATKERSARMNVEQQLADEAFQSASLADKLRKWRWYIRLETKADELSRAQRLLERAVLFSPDCASCEELWLDYAKFAAHTVRNYRLLATVTERALRLCFRSLPLWRHRLLALELLERPRQEFQAAVQASLLCGFPSPDSYLALLLAQCDFDMREARRGGGGTLEPFKCAALHATVRDSLAAAVTFLQTYFPSWLEGWLLLLRRRVAAEGELQVLASQFDPSADGLSAPTALWEHGVERLSSLYPAVWHEYIAWMQQRGELVRCRTLYQRAVGTKQNSSTEGLCLAWLDFERQHGSPEDLVAAMGRAGPIISHMTWKRSEADAQALAQAQVQEQEQGQGQGEAHTQLKGDRDEALSARSRKRSSAVAASSNDSGAAKRSRGEQQVQSQQTSGQQHSEAIRMECDHQPVPGDPICRTVHVRNLPFRASNQDLLALFSACGEIGELNVALTKAGKFSGTAFVTYGASEGYDRALLELNGSVHGGRTLRVERCERDDDDQTPLREIQQLRDRYKQIYSRPELKRRQDKEQLQDQEQQGARPVVEPTRHDAQDATVAEAAPASADHQQKKRQQCAVFVSHFSAELTDEGLRAIFEPSCGAIVEAKVYRDIRSGLSKRVGFVSFTDEAGVQAAFRLHKVKVNGEKVSVTPFRESTGDDADSRRNKTAAAGLGAGAGSAAAAAAAGTGDTQGQGQPAGKKLGFKPRTVTLKL